MVQITAQTLAELSKQFGVPVREEDYAEVATRLQDMFIFLAELDDLDLTEFVAEMHFDPAWNVE